MKQPPRFKVGDWVEVRATVKLSYPDGADRKVCRDQVEKPWKGQVVGLRHRPLGTYNGGYGEREDYEPPYLAIDGTVRLWQVVRGLMNRPVECLEEDLIALVPSWTPNKLPLKWAGEQHWDERARKFLIEEAKTWPRDAKGRWIKQNTTGWQVVHKVADARPLGATLEDQRARLKLAEQELRQSIDDQCARSRPIKKDGGWVHPFKKGATTPEAYLESLDEQKERCKPGQ